MKIFDYINLATSRLKDAQISSPRLDAELILAYVTHSTREWIIAHNDYELNNQQINRLDTLTDRRLSGEPIAYIIGNKEFYGRTFRVNSSVLIPRPETEQLVEFIKSLGTNPDAKILDVGTGSGIIAITLSLELPSALILASDISKEALAVAVDNSNYLGSNVKFIKSDLLNNISGKFNIIVANLPYVSRNWNLSKEVRMEPEIALFADDQGLKLIKELVTQSINHLHAQGLLILEMDTRQIDTVSSFADSLNFQTIARDKFLLVLKKS